VADVVLLSEELHPMATIISGRVLHERHRAPERTAV
jgi:hypothetical protein